MLLDASDRGGPVGMWPTRPRPDREGRGRIGPTSSFSLNILLYDIVILKLFCAMGSDCHACSIPPLGDPDVRTGQPGPAPRPGPAKSTAGREVRAPGRRAEV